MAATATLTLDQFAGEMDGIGRDLSGVSFQRPLKVCRQLIVSDVKQNFAGAHTPDGQPWRPLGRPRIRGGDKPLRDRGLLMASITGRGTGHIETLTDRALEVGTNLEHARIHQEGGTIRPTHAKALTIPLTKEASYFSSPRLQPDLFVFRSDTGKAFLAEAKKTGKGKRQKTKLILHWLLVKQAIIPARPFLGFGAKLVEQISDVFRDFLDGLVGGPGGGRRGN